MPVEFQDFSFQVKAALDDLSVAWLQETADEITSQAKRDCKYVDESGGKELRDFYANQVDEGSGEAIIGNPLEESLWEEWGTGEYAAHGDGRKGWWIYTPGNEGPAGYQSNIYASRQDAEQMADYIRAAFDIPAVVTNGRKPNYTLENAFKAVRPKAERRLRLKLKERIGK